MKILSFIKGELKGWGKIEKIVFPLGILLILAISLIAKDSFFVVLSAICGISYTILAGKGKISAFFFGLIGGLSYSYISFKNAFWGNLCLNLFYYIPMYFIGFYKWKKNLKKEDNTIKKQRLSIKNFIIYIVSALFVSLIIYFVLKYTNDHNPILDSIITVFSIFALIMTVKRTIEQWFFWSVVNFCAVLMWLMAYIKGVHCFGTILMWSIYFVLGIYFWAEWKKELSSTKTVN